MRKQLLVAVLFFLFLIYPASAFSIDTVEITIEGIEGGNANIDFHYSLSWWESIYYRYLAAISGGEKQLIESKFSEILGKKVEVTKLNTQSNDVTLRVSDFIAEKKDFKDGYWISYAGIVPKSDVFTIKEVTIIYPDGYIKTYDGKIPSNVHFVNDKLTSYNYISQYYQNLYDKSYGVYQPNNYKPEKILTIVGEMITKTGFYDFVINAGVKSIVVSSLPEKLQWIESLKGSIETITTGEPYKKLASLKDDEKLIGTVMKDSALIGYMGPAGDKNDVHKKIADYMKTMSELKAQEVTLLEKLSSEPKEWNNNLDLLIANLNNQKNILIKLIETSNTMVKDVQSLKEVNTVLSDDSISYLESISGFVKQISENDLKNVNDELEYLNKLKIMENIVKDYKGNEGEQNTPLPTPVVLAEGELGYDDGEKDGSSSVGSTYKIGLLVRFTAPKDGFIINKVKVYGYRFGNGEEWNGLGKSFSLEIWDNDFKTIYTMSSDYDRYFPKGEENIGWVEISTPSVKVNNDFYVFFNTNSIKSPMAEGGIDVGMDMDISSGRSFLAFANKTIITDPSKLEWSEGSVTPPTHRNWMIRVSNR